jgi:two-component system LytT family response regulator
VSLGVLIVDDELPARAKVRRLLQDDPRFHITGEAADGVEALERIEALSPAVLILDIQMPGLDGFQLLDATLRSPQGGTLSDRAGLVVVFSTAFDEHALRAFEAHAVDYLLKPYDEDRFRRAMDKAHAQHLGSVPPAPLHELAGRRTHLALKTAAGAWVAVPLHEVVRLRAANKHTRILLSHGREHVVRRSLGELEATLGREFARIHRTEVANLRAVRSLEPLSHGDGLITFDDGTSGILTRTYRTEFVARWREGGRSP